MNLIPFNSAGAGSLIEARGQSVYLLPTLDRSQVKIGQSVVPLRRIHGLHCLYPDIDLTRAAILAVDDHRVEKVLHTAFGKRRQSRSGKKDGHTEWFQGDIVEQAVALAHVIATHRETSYPEFRCVDQLVRGYLDRNPERAQRAPRLSKMERAKQAVFAEALVVERVLARTQAVIDFIDQRQFDAVVRYRNRAYLARTVLRQVETECWLPDGQFRPSAWGDWLCAFAFIDETIDGVGCLFHLLDLPTFVPRGPDIGTEFYRIPEDRPSAATTDNDAESLSNDAFSELWAALDSLPVIDASIDPVLESHGSRSDR